MVNRHDRRSLLHWYACLYCNCPHDCRSLRKKVGFLDKLLYFYWLYNRYFTCKWHRVVIYLAVYIWGYHRWQKCGRHQLHAWVLASKQEEFGYIFEADGIFIFDYCLHSYILVCNERLQGSDLDISGYHNSVHYIYTDCSARVASILVRKRWF